VLRREISGSASLNGRISVGQTKVKPDEESVGRVRWIARGEFGTEGRISCNLKQGDVTIQSVTLTHGQRVNACQPLSQPFTSTQAVFDWSSLFTSFSE
jgi:hypothetical protein